MRAPRISALGLAATLLLPGCASIGIATMRGDGSISFDAGVPGSDAAGAADFGTHPTLPDGSPGEGAEGRAGALSASDITGPALDSCYDGADNNGDGLVDCQDDGCAPLASCCAAVGAACCDDHAVIALPPFDACTGSLLSCALTGVSFFGTGAPYADGFVHPGGDHTNEGGVIVTAPLDRTRATFVAGTVALPTAAQCADGCIDSVGLGLIPEATLGATSTVRPVIALVATASLQQVMLVSGGVVLATTPVPGAGGVAFPVTLTLSAAGAVTATVDTMQLTASVPVPTATLHLVVYGHSENRAGIPSSGVRGLSLAQAVCDAPNVWASRNVVTIGAAASTAPPVTDAPSVAYSPTDAYLAFATDSGIFVAHRSVGTSDMPSSFALQAGYAAPDIGGGTGARSLSDPDIHFLPDGMGGGTWRVYVADLATGAIDVAEAVDAPTLVFGARTPTLLVSALPPSTTIDAFDGPSVTLPGTHGRSDYVLAARAHYPDGHHAIVFLTSADGTSGWTWLNGTEDASTLTVPSGLSDVAHDEVAGPSLLYRNGAWELYYGGRTLGRWSVGLMLSDDLVHWRAAPTSDVLAPTGAPTDFDAFSVRDPGVSVVDGQESRVELFYAGTDGASTRIGRVEHAATTSRATHP